MFDMIICCILFTKEKGWMIRLIYSLDELFYLFFVYSFIGWLYEVVSSAIVQKKFVNVGLVNLPFCTFYGILAVFVTVFSRGLYGAWSYIGSVISVVAIRWFVGMAGEKIYHDKIWDYTGKRLNIGGYASFVQALILGAVAFVSKHWINEPLVKAYNLVPSIVGLVIICALVVIVFIDAVATLIVFHGKGKNTERWKKVDEQFEGISKSLGDKIFSYIAKRLKKAYPKKKTADENVEQIKQAEEQKKKTIFAYGCGFYKVVWLFIIGAFLGDVVETIFMWYTKGVWMSRSSVVWGPFSVVWGLAFVFASILLHKQTHKSDSFLFLTGTFLGGAYEYACSVFTEIVFGKVFWDYSHIKYNLGGRVNLLYCFFWGIAAVVWVKYIYPFLSKYIEKIPMKIGKVITWIMVVFMICNGIVSSMALIRADQRDKGVEAEYFWQEMMDEYYDDATLKKIYPNALKPK